MSGMYFQYLKGLEHSETMRSVCSGLGSGNKWNFFSIIEATKIIQVTLDGWTPVKGRMQSLDRE